MYFQITVNIFKDVLVYLSWKEMFYFMNIKITLPLIWIFTYWNSNTEHNKQANMYNGFVLDIVDIIKSWFMYSNTLCYGIMMVIVLTALTRNESFYVWYESRRKSENVVIEYLIINKIFSYVAESQSYFIFVILL